MKAILTLFFFVFCLTSSGQSDPLWGRIEHLHSKNKLLIPDTIPLVVYNSLVSDDNQPACFINGKLSDPSLIKTLDLKFIDSIYVDHEIIELKKRTYNGQIHLVMKEDYQPKLISLYGLRLKYIGKSPRPAIFMIDDEFIKEDYDKYLVDEKFILKIVVDSVPLNGEKKAIDIVRLVTKTKENIKKAQEISVRAVPEGS